LSEEFSVVVHHRQETTPEAWQSWGLAVRYLLVRLADSASCGMLLWLAYVRR